MQYLASVCLIALLAVSCQESKKPDAAEKEFIRNEVQQTLNDYFADIKANGLMAEFKYLDNSTEFFWIPPGYMSWISYDSVAAILKSSASGYRSIDNKWDTVRVDPLTEEYATYTGKIYGTWIDTTGKVTKIVLIETGVTVKRQEGWKLLRGQTSILDEELE